MAVTDSFRANPDGVGAFSSIEKPVPESEFCAFKEKLNRKNNPQVSINLINSGLMKIHACLKLYLAQEQKHIQLKEQIYRMEDRAKIHYLLPNY